MAETLEVIKFENDNYSTSLVIPNEGYASVFVWNGAFIDKYDECETVIEKL